MKLIRCRNCEDIVRLIHTKWRRCECGSSGGQYNIDLLSATVGGDCEVIGIRNDFFHYDPFSKSRIEFDRNHIIQGEYFGDVQIHRIESGDDPRLKMKVVRLNSTDNELFFNDKRKFIINIDGDKTPKSITVPYNEDGPSFKVVN